MLSSLSSSRSVRHPRLGVEQLESRDVPTTMFGLVGNRILVFDSATPQVILKSMPISGLVNSNERVVDIDVRPATGGLYGRTNQGNLYLINPLSGSALFVGGPVSLSGVFAGIDFNSANDRLREVSNPGQNLVVNPNLGTLEATDTPLTYRAGDAGAGTAPRVTGIAYTNTFVFPPPTTLYGIDHIRNTLVVIGNPDPADGQVATVGSLGFDVRPRVGFDIVTTVVSPTNPTNVAFAAFQQPRQNFSGFYQINLTTGAATLIGVVGNNRLVTDIAVDLRNTSGFFPPAGRVAGIVGTAEATAPSAGSVYLPPVSTAPNPGFAIASERPGWFDYEPIQVG